MPEKIFLISFLVGFIQIVLSWLAGIHFRPSGEAGHWFGYLECYNWSVTYLTVVPFILAACIPNTFVLFRRSGRHPAYRRRFVALIFLALVYAAVTAGREGWSSLFDMEYGNYLEWTSVSAGNWNAPVLSPLQSISWHALFFLGYAHYFVGAFFGFAGAFGPLWYFALFSNHTSRNNQRRKLLQDEEVLLDNQRIAVLAYLFYLVLLRSAKVWMSLVADGKAIETWKNFDFFKHGDAYFEAISGGLLFDLLCGVFWLTVTLATHGFACQIISPHNATPTQRQSLRHIFDWAARAYAYFGRGALFWTGVLLFGIVLPAPGFPLLVGAAVVFGTLQLIKSGLSKKSAE